jgi:hypothetical protein
LNPDDDGTVKLSISNDEEKAYIGGGGLNVRDIGNDTMQIYYPGGCVLELLEALLGRTTSLDCRTTVVSFLHVAKKLGFGIRGHLFEWLIAHDITCANSELNDTMKVAHGVERTRACIGAKPVSDPQVYACIVNSVHLIIVCGLFVIHTTRTRIAG